MLNFSKCNFPIRGRAYDCNIWIIFQKSSVVWGMPGAVVEAGLAATIKPLDQLAADIANRVQSRMASILSRGASQ